MIGELIMWVMMQNQEIEELYQRIEKLRYVVEMDNQIFDHYGINQKPDIKRTNSGQCPGNQ